MIELALLAMFSRLMTWGLGPIIASRTVGADRDVVCAVLSDPDNQARLATSRPGALALRPGHECCGAPCRLPSGVTLQVKAPTPRVLKTEVRLHRRSVAWATWILIAGRGSTEVDLALQFESRGLGTRLVVLLGGRWIARRLDMTLAALATASARAAEDLLALPAAAAVPTARARGTRASATRPGRVAVHR